MSTVTIHTGDSRKVLRSLRENSVDAIVTDPPYELGFMGKAWDRSGIANDVKFWDDCLRVLKPGGHLLAFSGSRTYHRMTCAIEDAGFEVRDQMMWVYGSGFPKSLNVGKALDKEAGVKRHTFEEPRNGGGLKKGQIFEGGFEQKSGIKISSHPATDLAKQWDGWGTALKPAHEPICVARKPLDGTVAENIRKWGVGGLNIDGCRVGNTVETWPSSRKYGGRDGHSFSNGPKHSETQKTGAPPKGRWPANLMHDGSEEVLGLFPGDADSSPARFFYCPKASKRDRNEGCEDIESKPFTTSQPYGEGAEARAEGNAKGNPNNHPTVKPTELMRYLCRLVTPPGGTVLDPFLGSGSTGKAAVLEGFSFVGIDLSAEYAEIAKARIDHALRNK